MDLPEARRSAIENELFAGRKIQAIKRLREASGLGLKEAKDVVDALELELRSATPEKFAAGRKSGCLGLIVIVGGLGAVLAGMYTFA